jgi:hypothetical protein
MSKLLLVVKYGEVDMDHDLFVRGCFGDIDGTQVPLMRDFDTRQPLGAGILRDREDGLYVEVENDISLVAALGGGAIDRSMSNRGDYWEIKAARVNVIGMVPTKNKVK